MKDHRFLKSVFLAMFMMMWLVTLAHARIPEPDNIIYGELPPEINVVSLKLGTDIVASYTRGDNPNAGDHFILRVPMDAVDPRQVGSARPGDSCDLFVDQDLIALMTVAIGDKGSIQEISLLAAVDTDGDLVFDDIDNCREISNADQLDDDDDGVGNVCDNCIDVANTDQANFDQDEYGDACDTGDSDGDLMPDDYEYRVGLQVGVNDGGGDADGDGTLNYQEYLDGTNPVPMCGDISDDTYVELDDLIQAIQTVSGVAVSPSLTSDCNSDLKIGIVEALEILNELGGN